MQASDGDQPPSSGDPSPASEAKDPFARALHSSVVEVHRDEHLWVLDKPAGILSHPNLPSVKSSSALVQGVYDHEGEFYSIGKPSSAAGPARVWLVHRLDQDTSGLILATFDGESAARLKEDLYNQDLDKEYRALLLSAPKPPLGTWEDRLSKTSVGGRIEVRVKSGAKKNALTSYELLRTFPGTGLSLVSMKPHTGRTHQLRVQAARRGHPIAGDERYGDFVTNRFLEERIGLKHMFLHAYRLVLRHPRTGHRMTFSRDFTQRLSLPLEALETLGTRLPRSQKKATGGPQTAASRPRGRPGYARGDADARDGRQSSRRGAGRSSGGGKGKRGGSGKGRGGSRGR